MPPGAAQFIVDEIVKQAATENVGLSNVERKMLLFYGSSPTLPDIGQANELFDRDYDRLEYEAKITSLIKHIKSKLRGNADATRSWNEAIGNLSGEDYYFMVMLNEAGVQG